MANSADWQTWEMAERLTFYKHKDEQAGGKMPTTEELKLWREECDAHIATTRAALLVLPWSLGDDGMTIRDADGRLVVAPGGRDDMNRARLYAQAIVEAVNTLAPGGLVDRLRKACAKAQGDTLCLRKALDYVRSALEALHAQNPDQTCPFCGAPYDVPASTHGRACPRYVVGEALCTHHPGSDLPARADKEGQQ